MAHVNHIYDVEMKEGPQSNFTFTIHLTAGDKRHMREHILLDYQKTMTKPGFRKGHVPLSIVEKEVNPANILMNMLEHFVNTSLQSTIDKHPDIRWIGDIYNLDTSKYGHDEDAGELSFQLDVFPEVIEKNEQRKEYKPKKFVVQVTHEDINKTLDQLRASYANFDDVEVVTKTSLMRLKLTFLDKKKAQIGHTKNQYLGEEELSQHPELHDNFVGKKKGDIVTLSYTKASNIALLKIKEGDAASIECEIIDIKQKVLPELNQEFIDKAFQQEDEIKSVDDLTKKIEETLAESKYETQLFEWIDDYLTHIDTSFSLMVPQTLIEEETKHRLGSLGEQLGGEKGLQNYLDNMGEQEAKKYVESIRNSANISIHKYFIMKYIADELQLDIDWNQSQKSGDVEHKLYEKLTELA